MTISTRIATRRLLLIGAMVASAPAAFSASHLWTINELYSNADGTIQFIEMYNCCASDESNIINKDVRSTSHTFFFPGNLPANTTTDKHLLLATNGFAALPGAPTPDYVVPVNFFSRVADEVRWWNYTFPDSELNYSADQLPTDGLHSLNQLGNGFGASGVATPTNYSGRTFAPPGVAGLTVGRAAGFPNGDRLDLDLDATACLGTVELDVYYGWGSSLRDVDPVYAIQPASPDQCGFDSLPHVWNGVPDPSTDSSRLLWFVVVATDGRSTEGSWGRASDGTERAGPAAQGSSGQCGMITKRLVNTCGQ